MIFTGILFIGNISAQTITPQNHATGAIPVSSATYATYPLPNWDTLTKYAPNKVSSNGGE